MIKKSITLQNKYGLHTRASAKLVDIAKKFSSKVTLVKQKNNFDGKSIMSLMAFGGRKGTKFDLIVTGEDEREAMLAITKLIRNKFGEAE